MMSEMNPLEDQPKTRTGYAPLDVFMQHQRRAMKETGRALAALLPKEFRTHAGVALDETRASWEALFDGVLDTLQSNVQKMKATPAEDSGKVKVEVE